MQTVKLQITLEITQLFHNLDINDSRIDTLMIIFLNLILQLCQICTKYALLSIKNPESRDNKNNTNYSLSTRVVSVNATFMVAFSFKSALVCHRSQ